nr:hypothetical protein [Parasedimentitalea marina]
MAGQHHHNFIVTLAEGSGGTSTNINFNEVIANRAGQIFWAIRLGPLHVSAPMITSISSGLGLLMAVYGSPVS